MKRIIMFVRINIKVICEQFSLVFQRIPLLLIKFYKNRSITNGQNYEKTLPFKS